VGVTVVEEPQVDPRYAAAAVDTAVPPAAALPVSAELLDGGEIVILAVKPSMWFVLFDSIRWVLLGAFLLIMTALPGLDFRALSNRTVGKIACLLIVARLSVAILRWTSRLYVLTNRRVMRTDGVFRPEVVSCPLRDITSTMARVAAYERPFGLGTVCMCSESMPATELHWYHVARCEDVHAEIRRAIDRSHHNGTRV
jgi:hypothetical protein